MRTVHIAPNDYGGHQIRVDGRFRFDTNYRPRSNVFRLVQLWDLRDATPGDLTEKQARQLARKMCLDLFNLA
jgi:hypothetical protein